VGSIVVNDNGDTEMLQGSTWIVWDKAVRGPMVALSSYLLYANVNTRFMYHNNPFFVYWGLDEFLYHNATPDWATTSDVAADTSTNIKYVSGDFSSFPDAAGTLVRMGNTGEYVTWKKVNNTQLSTAERIGASYPSGTQLFRVLTGRMSSDDLPPIERIHSWRQYFPAMNADIGLPDTGGYNAGQGNPKWKSPSDSATLNGLQRRDFTKAIILYADAAGVNGGGGVKWNSLNTYGAEYTFASEGMPETLYPLLPNGSTGAGITSLRLRTGDGAVLMKEPVY
jgi:hypothetical protein